ncbi:hypothetical protein COOONC_10992 [Cooperia oncophora]
MNSVSWETPGKVNANGGKIDKLKVADDFMLLDPCKVEEQVYGTSCGTMFCNEALGEECIAGKLCGCPKGQKRKDAQSPCRVVESFNLPLYVVRDGNNPLKYTPALANPRDDRHKELVERFESGVGDSYDKTPLKSGFVSAEVNDIEEPSLRNAVRNLWNCTQYKELSKNSLRWRSYLSPGEGRYCIADHEMNLH